MYWKPTIVDHPLIDLTEDDEPEAIPLSTVELIDDDMEAPEPMDVDEQETEPIQMATVEQDDDSVAEQEAPEPMDTGNDGDAGK